MAHVMAASDAKPTSAHPSVPSDKEERPDLERRAELKMALGAVMLAPIGVAVAKSAVTKSVAHASGLGGNQYIIPPAFTQDPQGAPPGAIWYRSDLGKHRYVNGATGTIEDVEETTTGTVTDTDTLAGLADVNLTSPQGQQYLQYDATSGKWINQSFPSVPPSTVAGTTAGTITIREEIDVINSVKKIMLVFNGYENDTANSQTINFPVALVSTSNPILLSNISGLTFNVTLTGITIIAPNSTNTFTGVVEVIGQ